MVGKADEKLKLEWVRDTAFRYFPVVDDDDLGYRLHDVDLEINKCLALANRSAVRDALDIIEIDRDILTFPAIISAACGKDPGFTREFMLEMIQRHITFTPDQLEAESLTKSVDPVKLKKDPITLLDQTRITLQEVPAKAIGCLFTDKMGNVHKDLSKLKLNLHKPHHGTVRESWPKIVN